jgi:thiamine biosynthesis protein ThiI
MREEAVRQAGGRPYGCFRIEARRANKAFPMISQEINADVGRQVLTEVGGRVDLTNPDLTIHIEVLFRDAYVYSDKFEGPGGLPVGVSGTVATLLSGGIDSPVAALRMMRRGCRSVFVHFHSFPMTSRASQEKAASLVEVLTGYQFTSRLHYVPFLEAQRAIQTAAPPAYRVVLYRRMMMRVAERIARREGAAALVTGESLGQVASQTLENLAAIGTAATLPVLRPLIGTDKQEIIQESRRAGLFDISILPDEDCCSLLVPRRPVTRSDSAELDGLEALLDVPALVESCVSRSELRRFGHGGPEEERPGRRARGARALDSGSPDETP